MSSPKGAPAPALPPNAFDDISGTVIGVVSFCLVWSTLMVGLRLWTRKVIINQLGWDDYMIVVGLVWFRRTHDDRTGSNRQLPT